MVIEEKDFMHRRSFCFRIGIVEVLVGYEVKNIDSSLLNDYLFHSPLLVLKYTSWQPKKKSR